MKNKFIFIISRLYKIKIKKLNQIYFKKEKEMFYKELIF